MKEDKLIAKKFPEIDWIIGSHSQNFTQKTVDVGETKLVQMLSRNHYIGDLTLSKDSPNISFSFHEVNQDLAEKVKDNPLTKFVDAFQKEFNEIQKLSKKRTQMFYQYQMKIHAYLQQQHAWIVMILKGRFGKKRPTL